MQRRLHEHDVCNDIHAAGGAQRATFKPACEDADACYSVYIRCHGVKGRVADGDGLRAVDLKSGEDGIEKIGMGFSLCHFRTANDRFTQRENV